MTEMSLLLCPVQRNYWFSPSRSAKIFSVAHRRTDVQSILLSHTLYVVVCTLLRLAPQVCLFGFFILWQFLLRRNALITIFLNHEPPACAEHVHVESGEVELYLKIKFK